MRSYGNLDKQFEAYLAGIAGETIDNQTMKAERVRVHYASREPGILVPFWQAVISGFLAAVAVLVSGLAVGWSGAWILALVVFALGSLGMWFFLLADWRKLIHKLEDFTKTDINKDFTIGEPERVRVEISENGGQNVKILDLPCSLEKLSMLARETLRGVPLSESNWTGGGKPFNRRDFSTIRADLLKRGLLAWVSPGTTARGVMLTKTGKSAFKYLASLPEAVQSQND